MTRVLLIALVLLALSCGKSDEERAAKEQVPVAVSQDSLHPPAGWKNQPGVGPKVTELSLGRKPGSPWVFRPRKDVPDWDFSLPLDWSVDPFDDRNWQHHLHSWRGMEYWLHEFRRDGDVNNLAAPIKIALDWHHFHVEESQTSLFQWYDHSTGLRASRLAFLLSFILSDQIEVSESDLASLMTLADLHTMKLLEPEFLSSNNHGLFQMVGLDALCSVVGWRSACKGANSYAREEYADLVTSWFSDEGVHLENSPYYHDWVIRKIRELGAVDRFQEPRIQEILERADAVTPWLTYPGGRLVPVGDSYGGGPQLAGSVKATCLADDAGCWAARDLTKSGYAVIRSLPETHQSESSMLFVSATAVTKSHKHSDDLSFVLMESGREVFTDSGMYSFDFGDIRNYMLSARAHNVLSLVGRRIDPHVVDQANSHLEPLLVEENMFIVNGVVSRPGLFTHERTFSYLPGVFLRIEDRLHNLTELQWQSNLHLAHDLMPVMSDTGFVVETDDLTVRGEFSGEGCEITAIRGETDPYQGWVSVGYLELAPATVVVATCPADLVESSWYITFE